MKTIMLPIHSKWCEKIFNGEKTIEVRKFNIPTPFKVVVYQPLGKAKSSCKIFVPKPYGNDEPEWFYIHEGCGMVVGEFIVNYKSVLKYSTTIPNLRLYEFGYLITDERGIPKQFGEITIEPYYNAALSVVKGSCLEQEELVDYGKGKPLYGYHITEPKLYDRVRELREFRAIDKSAIKNCEYRERVYNNPDHTNGALLKGGYVCNNDYENNWCNNCKTMPITRAPQNFYYIQEPEEETV